jgi:DNA adenine methylase
LPYFGSKRLIAPQIVSRFGPHEIYYDLFAGSLAVLFAKEPCRQEVASEKNPEVINLLRHLSHKKTAKWLHKMTAIHPISEKLFYEAAWRTMDPAGASSPVRALDTLLLAWQGPSGLAGTTAKPRFAKRNTASGGSTAARWRSVAESIPAWHERLRNVEFRNADAFEIFEDIPDRPGVVVYADPPYHPDSRRGGSYQFEFTLSDHDWLAANLQRFKKAKVFVSYYECEATARMYDGWHKVKLTAPRKLNNTGDDTSVSDAGEVLYCNGAAVA